MSVTLAWPPDGAPFETFSVVAFIIWLQAAVHMQTPDQIENKIGEVNHLPTFRHLLAANEPLTHAELVDCEIENRDLGDSTTNSDSSPPAYEIAPAEKQVDDDLDRLQREGVVDSKRVGDTTVYYLAR